MWEGIIAKTVKKCPPWKINTGGATSIKRGQIWYKLFEIPLGCLVIKFYLKRWRGAKYGME